VLSLMVEQIPVHNQTLHCRGSQAASHYKWLSSYTIHILFMGVAQLVGRIKLKVQIARLGQRLTRKQQDDIATSRTQLEDRIDAFHRQASLHMPSVSNTDLMSTGQTLWDDRNLMEDEGEMGSDDDDVFIADDISDMDDVESKPETASILLPSSLHMVRLDELGLTTIAGKEASLREGQANDALEGLRSALGEKSLIFRAQLRNAKSQKQSTKSWDAVHRINNRIKVQLHVYHNARQALIQLGVSTEVQAKFQEIKKEHLKMSGNILEENRFGQRNDVVAWFWRLGPNGLQSKERWMNECECRIIGGV
jgi:hypothetical protein